MKRFSSAMWLVLLVEFCLLGVERVDGPHSIEKGDRLLFDCVA